MRIDEEAAGHVDFGPQCHGKSGPGRRTHGQVDPFEAPRPAIRLDYGNSVLALL